MPGKRWTKTEDALLRKIYWDFNLTPLLKTRTYYAITSRASIFNIKTNRIAGPKTNGDVSKLLEETPEAYYWAGFIAADGHLTKNNGLQIVLSAKDAPHLLKFARYLNCSNIHRWEEEQFGKIRPYIKLTIQDRLLIPKFAKKFDLKHNKTYSPPNLAWLRGDKFLAFFAGFVDGDGYISKHTNCKTFQLGIECHSSWEPVFKSFIKKLYMIFPITKTLRFQGVRIIRNNKVLLTLGNSSILKKLKKQVTILKLPILKRKWNKISLNYTSTWENLEIETPKVWFLHKQGFRQYEIANKVNLCLRTINKILNAKKKKRNPPKQ